MRCLNRPAKPSTRRRSRLVVIVVLGACLAIVGAVGTAWGAFADQGQSSGNQFQAAPDFVAPSVTGSVIQKTEGGVAGYIRKAGTYRVYSSVTDSGNPASGVATVAGNLTSITSGQNAASLASGSFTVDGQTYDRQSASLTAGASLAAGTQTYSLSSTDTAGNARTQTGFSVIVDNTAPAGSAVNTANHTGGIAGRPEAGDSITFSYSEAIDPNSVLSNWSGSTTAVVVRISNNVAGSSGHDTVTVYNATNANLLPLGTVDLGGNDYVSQNLTFGATGTASTMSQSGNTTAVTLGTASATGTTAAKHAIVWSPATGATDRAGNPAVTTAVSESGVSDRDF
jgi:hypothetical protein